MQPKEKSEDFFDTVTNVSAEPVRGHQECVASAVKNVYCPIVLYRMQYRSRCMCLLGGPNCRGGKGQGDPELKWLPET